MQDPLGELAGASTRQWSVIGATSASGAACVAGEGAQYTFQGSSPHRWR